METCIEKNAQIFLPFLRKIIENGVGFKEVFFRMNMSVPEIIKDGEEFPRDAMRDGELIIKFSDGDNFLSALHISEEIFRAIDNDRNCRLVGEFDYLGKDTFFVLFNLRKYLFPALDYDFELRVILKFNAVKDYGRATIEITPPPSERHKGWWMFPHYF